MQMTKAQIADYKLVRPKDKKFTLTDLSKYLNAADMMPHYVSWGGEVNAAHFHNNMLQQWNKDNSVYNELFYKELIGKKILFAYIESVVSDQTWYQERRAYRPQIVAYTFAKLVQEAKKLKKAINFRQIWDAQRVLDVFENDVAGIAKLVFGTIYDDSRSTANIETYCKKEECWQIVSKKNYDLSDELIAVLVSPYEREIEETRAKKEQKFGDGIMTEVEIFTKGSQYWQSMIERGTAQDVLTAGDVVVLKAVINYCNGIYAQLSKYQVSEVIKIQKKLKDNMIE